MVSKYTHVDHGAKFKIECRLKTWKERTFWQKVKFWRKYSIGFLDDDDLFNIIRPLPKKLAQSDNQSWHKELADDFNKTLDKDEDDE